MSFEPRLTGPGVDALLSNDWRIIITGAGGWVGRATLELLFNTLGATTFQRRVAAFGSTARNVQVTGGPAVEQQPLSELARLAAAPSVLLHLAFLTKDRAEWMDEEEYIRANRELSAIVLNNLDRIGVQAVFVASSGAARSADDAEAAPAMRLYGRLKREDEAMFAGWAEAGSKRAVIARIFNLSGPHINKHGNYALASFILDALAARPIEIRATRRVVRGYVAIRELMSLVFAQLLDGKKGVTRFESGGKAREIGEVAETVSALVGPVSVRRPDPTDEASDHYCGDDAEYCRLLTQYSIESVTFSQQILETASFLSKAGHLDWHEQQADARPISAQ